MNKKGEIDGKYYEILVDNPEYATVLKGDIVKATRHSDFFIHFTVVYTPGRRMKKELEWGCYRKHTVCIDDTLSELEKIIYDIG